MDLKAAIIGCGRPWKSEGATGAGMSHEHARGYAQVEGVTLVAGADIIEDNARAFADQYGLSAPYLDYHEMIAVERPDVVSICTWPALHEQMVLDCIAAKVPAIHCEKPISPTWGAAKRMVGAAKEAGIQLTFNHQRRFDPAYMHAKQCLDDGLLGELQLLEMPTANLFDWGTHWFDMMFYYNNQVPAKWVLGQVEPTGGGSVFGVKLEGQAIMHVAFENGVQGISATGREHNMHVQNRLTGTKGRIEIGATGWDSFRIWVEGQSTWQEVKELNLPEGSSAIGRGIQDLCNALDQGFEPELSGRKALMATELIFATYESSRQGKRIDLPLSVADSAIRAE